MSLKLQEYHFVSRSHTPQKKIARKSMLECGLDCDVNSNTNARTQVLGNVAKRPLPWRTIASIPRQWNIPASIIGLITGGYNWTKRGSCSKQRKGTRIRRNCWSIFWLRRTWCSSAISFSYLLTQITLLCTSLATNTTRIFDHTLEHQRSNTGT